MCFGDKDDSALKTKDNSWHIIYVLNSLLYQIAYNISFCLKTWTERC